MFTRQKKLPNLCDPSKGNQLFPEFDKCENWNDFESGYQNEVAQRFVIDAAKDRQLTIDVNNFVTRMYKLDSTLTAIKPGLANKHIDELVIEQKPKQ